MHSFSTRFFDCLEFRCTARTGAPSPEKGGSLRVQMKALIDKKNSRRHRFIHLHTVLVLSSAIVCSVGYLIEVNNTVCTSHYAYTIRY